MEEILKGGVGKHLLSWHNYVALLWHALDKVRHGGWGQAQARAGKINKNKKEQ
jgi:hypothetical protein